MINEEWHALDTGGGLAMSEGDARVLEQASRNIQDQRRADALFRFTNREGRPLARLPVEIRQVTAEFAFGDQTWELDRMHRFGQERTDRAEYWRRLFSDCFNSATTLCYWTERPQNDGPKTEDIQGREQLEHFDAVARWAASEGMHVKGHPLFWSIDKCWPGWLRRYDQATQMKFAEVRVRDLLARFGDMVRTWDVVNEALWEPAPENLARRHWPHLEPPATIASYVSMVLEWARSERPACTYVLNDYGLTQDAAGASITAADGSVVTAARQRERLMRVVDELDARGSLPDALGLQTHTGGLFSPETLWAVYDELGATGLPLHITEFWATADVIRAALEADGRAPSPEDVERATADYVDRVLTAAYGHPAVDAFSFWGLMGSAVRWHEHHSGHAPGPVYERVRSMLHDRWRTHEHVETDSEGIVRVRAFPGDYDVTWPQGSGDVPAGRRLRVTGTGANDFHLSALRTRSGA